MPGPDRRPAQIGISKHVLDEAAHVPQISNAGGTSGTANAFQIPSTLLQRVGTGLYQTQKTRKPSASVVGPVWSSADVRPSAAADSRQINALAWASPIAEVGQV